MTRTMFVIEQSSIECPGILYTAADKGKRVFMNVYVGNISRHISDEQFRALALPFGNADSVSVPRDIESGRTKGYGFLEFTNRDEALAVIAGLNGKDIDGQILNASEANAARGIRRI